LVQSDLQTERLAVLRASLAGTASAPNMTAYAASKHAVMGFSEGLALVGPFAKPMYHLRRLSRGLAQRLMLNDARKAGYS